MQHSPSPDAQPYWDGLNTGQILVQRCNGCGALRHYPRPMCRHCHVFEHSWVPLSGHGTVHSWTSPQRSALPDLAGAGPFTVLTVDMAEGVRLLGALAAGQAPGRLAIGAAVQASTVLGATGVLQPVFRWV